MQSVRILDMRVDTDRRAFARVMNARQASTDTMRETARKIVNEVRDGGDRALFRYTRQFDKVSLTSRTVRLDPASFAALARTVPPKLKRAIREAAKRIRAYHQRQKMQPFSMRTAEGTLSQLVRPLQRVGLYVPGGHTVYPSSVLMNVIPAQVAGVPEIAVVTPPRGGLEPVLAYTFTYLGIDEVYQVGGAQAIGALAYGTKSIPAVDKIVGPGRTIVALAKQLVYGTVDIDMIAGSSEVAVVADASVDPRLVALDLLSQAEHGSGDELAVCVTESKAVARRIAAHVEKEIEASPVRDVLRRLPASALSICVTRSRAASMALVNDLAPEHLQLMTRTCRKDLDLVKNAGAVFLGEDTPVPMGDYFIGTNHVLPTGGAARYASALGADDFQKRISVARASRAGLRTIVPHVSVLARAEGFVHHGMSVEGRVK